MKSKAFQVMPCFSTGIPVNSEAIVGRRRAGVTAAADQVTDPSFTKRLKTGIAPVLRESFPTPSSTNRITCSGWTSALEAPLWIFPLLEGDAVLAAYPEGIEDRTTTKRVAMSAPTINPVLATYIMIHNVGFIARSPVTYHADFQWVNPR